MLEGRVARVRGGEGAEGCDDGSAGEDELGFVRDTVGGYEGDSTEVELGVRKEVVRKKKRIESMKEGGNVQRGGSRST